MDIEAGRRRKRLKIVSDELSDVYPLDLQMYTLPPSNEITLSEFEDLAFDRLQFLRILERTTHKGHKLFTTEWKDCVKADVRSENLLKYSRLFRGGSASHTEADFQARRADHLSHFILRLAYCRSEDLRRWFLARELEFFKLRFMSMSSDDINKFLDHNNLQYSPISAGKKDSILDKLIESTMGLYDSKIETTDFYKVPFTEVCSLVKSRKVYLHKGFAYIPSSELISCISTIFRAKLSEALARTNKWLPYLDDERIDNLLKNLHTSYTGNDYSNVQNSKHAINIANMDMHARQHFPICMRHIHDVFRSTHHLKHGCRLQYGLFLKGIGVTLEDAMRYFREEFTKAIDENKFEKDYAYNIKHQYGKVGNMTSYSPYSCIKIITGSVGVGDHHGCPFKHWDVSILKQKLSEYGISTEGAQDIADMATKGHYQLACGKYFEYIHGQESKNAINHPNQYFEESFSSKNEGKGSGSFKTSQKSNTIKQELNDALDESVI